MKYYAARVGEIGHPSRPVWGAWIEIMQSVMILLVTLCRAPYGARGLKSVAPVTAEPHHSVAPRMGRVD